MKTVAVIFGAKSTEHDVSIVTAISSVIKPLELTGQYQVEAIYIDKQGAWYWDDRLKDISLFSSGKIEAFLSEQPALYVQFDRGMTLSKPAKLGRKKEQRIDVVFPATHGTYGEDGSLMGLLRMAGVPFVGCDMEASVISMNKLLSHQVVAASGVQSHPYIGFNKSEYDQDKDSVLARIHTMNYPLFVKPVHLGSSIGITKVTDDQGLENAIEVACHYDTTAIVEEAIANLIEVTVPVMGPADQPTLALVEQPLLTPGETFDFEAKYLKQGKGKKSGAKQSGAQGYSNLPAQISPVLYERCEALARTVYSAVGCEGLARIDLLIDGEAEKVYFNEINPLPGSLYTHNWQAAGISAVELVSRLVQLAEQRAADQKQHVATSFSTNYLKQF